MLKFFTLLLLHRFLTYVAIDDDNKNPKFV